MALRGVARRGAIDERFEIANGRTIRWKGEEWLALFKKQIFDRKLLTSLLVR